MVDNINISKTGSLNNLNKTNKRSVPKGTDYDKIIKQNSTSNTTSKDRIEVNGYNNKIVNNGNFDPVQSFKEIEKYKEIAKSSVDNARLAKLDKIKRAIENGTYNVDSFKVADKILKSGFFS